MEKGQTFVDLLYKMQDKSHLSTIYSLMFLYNPISSNSILENEKEPDPLSI